MMNEKYGSEGRSDEIFAQFHCIFFLKHSCSIYKLKIGRGGVKDRHKTALSAKLKRFSYSNCLTFYY